MSYQLTNFLENTIKELFNFKDKYPAENWFDLNKLKDKDTPIGEFLYENFRDVYDFITSVAEIVYIPEYDGVAAITIEKDRPFIILNPHRFTYIFKELGKKYTSKTYYIVAGILYHEMLHFVFKHFRLPSQGYDHTILNYAQDIAIDNYIKTRIEGWRDWRCVIEKINENIDIKGLIFPKITLEKEEGKKEVLNLSDTDLYLYITKSEVQEKLKDIPRFDKHSWGGEKIAPVEPQGTHQQPSNLPGEEKGGSQSQSTKTGQKITPVGQQGQQRTHQQQTNLPEEEKDGSLSSTSSTTDQKEEQDKNKQSKQKDEDITDELYYKFVSNQRKNADKTENDFLLSAWQDNTISNVYKLIDDTKTYDLYNILRRYVRKLSEKQKRQTWHKINKRYPFMYPGNIYKKQVGEIFLVIDISGSMLEFLGRYLTKVVSDIYNSFEKLAKFYTPDIKLYYAEVDDNIRTMKELNKIEELKNIRASRGGGTDYTAVFNYIKDWSKNVRKFNKYSENQYPDLIIFISDFDTDSIKNIDEEIGKAIHNKLLWIYTENNLSEAYNKPRFGTIIKAFSFFKLKEREVLFKNA